MSAADSLRSLVQKGASERPPFDRGKAIAAWQARVDSLLTEVTSWLSWITESNGSIERLRLQAEEERLGSYEIDGLALSLNGREFLFEPRGRYIIGASGRIDLYEVGRVEHIALLLYLTDRQDARGGWELRSPTERLSGVTVNRETLHEVLLRWMKD